MTVELLLQILVPAILSFAAGHFHLVIPNPLKGGAAADPALTAGVGHGEIIAWLRLLARLGASVQPAPVAPVGPVVPAVPTTAASVLAEVLAILKQVLAQPTPTVPPPQVPAVGIRV